MATKWDEQAKIDKAVLAALQPLGDEGTTFDTLFHITKAPHRVALSKSLQRLIGQELVTQMHDVKAGSVPRYIWVIPVGMRHRFAPKVSA